MTDAPALESKQLSNRKESPKLAAGRNSDKNSLTRKPSSAGGGFMLVGRSSLEGAGETNRERGGGVSAICCGAIFILCCCERERALFVYL